MSEVKKGTPMSEERKRRISEGRKRAKEQRAIAEQLFDECGEMLVSWKFWRKIDAATRDGVFKAIKKANVAVINSDIRSLQTQLAAMQAMKDELDS